MVIIVPSYLGVRFLVWADGWMEGRWRVCRVPHPPECE